MARSLVFLVGLALAGCGGADAGNNASEPAGNEGQVPVLSEGEGADLANEAAADEAADMELFGGNAAAGEQPAGNAAGDGAANAAANAP